MYMFIYTHLPAICLKYTNGCALQESVYVVLIKFKSSELIKTMVMYTFHYIVDRIKCAPYRDNFQLFTAHSLVADFNTQSWFASTPIYCRSYFVHICIDLINFDAYVTWI